MNFAIKGCVHRHDTEAVAMLPILEEKKNLGFQTGSYAEDH